jgi:hypothetical protein
MKIGGKDDLGVGQDAHRLILKQDLNMDSVIARVRLMVDRVKALVKGIFDSTLSGGIRNHLARSGAVLL